MRKKEKAYEKTQFLLISVININDEILFLE